MFIIDYIKNLTLRFGKNQIQKGCLATEESLRTHTIPAYTAAAETFKAVGLKSKEVLEFSKTFAKFAGGGSAQFISTILETLENSTKILSEVYKKSEVLFQDQEASIALSFEKVTYLRLIGAISFTNDFSRKLLNYIYILETAAVDKDFELKGSLSPTEIKQLEDSFVNFCLACKILQMPFSKMVTMINEVPDAVYSASSEKIMEATIGQSKVDPLGFRNFTVPITISVKWNPFYWIGIVIADIQVASYKAAKEELDLIQMRKLNLEKLYDKKPDPRLQIQIQALADRVAALNYNVEKMEADSGL